MQSTFVLFHQAEATLVDNASMADDAMAQYTVSQALDIIGNMPCTSFLLLHAAHTVPMKDCMPHVTACFGSRLHAAMKVLMHTQFLCTAYDVYMLVHPDHIGVTA